MEVMKVLDEMEELIENSGRIPLTGKVIIAAEPLLESIDRIRSLFPEELRQAQWVSKERDRILTEAEQEAQQMVSKTHSEVQLLAKDTEIVKEANYQAANMLMEAQQKAVEIEQGANSYALDVLKSLDENLSKVLNIVRKGQEELTIEESKE